MQINNSLSYEYSKTSNITNFYEIFDLFFDDEMLNVLIANTNEYARLYFNFFVSHTKLWKSIEIEEFRVYIVTYIYIDLHKKVKIFNYWNQNINRWFIHYRIRNHIDFVRWQSIDRFFHIFKSQSLEEIILNRQTLFEKLKLLSEKLRTKFKKHWEVETHLFIDEVIRRFMSRVKKIVNISTKSMIEGFKIWMFVNNDYVLNWMYRVKDENADSVNLNNYWIKILEFSKTQTVVQNLVS